MKSLVLEQFESSTATALIEPEPDPDEEQARLAEIEAKAAADAVDRAAHAARQEAIADAIAALTEHAEQNRLSATHALCAELGQIVSGLLPSLVEPLFAEEIASASAALINSAGIPDASLHVSPADSEIIIAELQRRNAEHPITIVTDTKGKSGTAHLSWTSGGARFDCNAWVDEMRALLAANISARTNAKAETS